MDAEVAAAKALPERLLRVAKEITHRAAFAYIR